MRVGGGVARGGFISFRLARRGELVTGWAGDKREEGGYFNKDNELSNEALWA